METGVGLLSIVTCRVINGSVTVYNSNGGIFPKVSVNEKLRSIQYTDVCQEMVSDCSMRSAARKIERVTHSICNPRTLDDWMEREGFSIKEQIHKQSSDILKEHGFEPKTGSLLEGTQLSAELTKPEIKTIPRDEVVEAIRKYNENKPEDEKIIDEWAEHSYVSALEGVNVSIDDIGVVEQKSSGREKGAPPKEHKKRVENTVVHIQNNMGFYVLTGLGMLSVVATTLAFLLENKLLKNQAITFFVDGALNIKNSIHTVFGWRPFEIVLDWYHLSKKCAERLSLIMKGSKLRNETYTSLSKVLWRGNVDAAINFLKNIPADKIKAGGEKEIENLVNYIQKNRNFIPCYALRKELNLRNSSNYVEKFNDLVVAIRQKNKGMSWSRSGSTALANICAMLLNDETHAWNYNSELRFSLNYRIPVVA